MNYLNNNAIKQREEAGAYLADGVLKLAQSEAQAMVDVPGVGPARLNAPMSGASGDDETEDADATAKYLGLLRNRTAI